MRPSPQSASFSTAFQIHRMQAWNLKCPRGRQVKQTSVVGYCTEPTTRAPLKGAAVTTITIFPPREAVNPDWTCMCTHVRTISKHWQGITFKNTLCGLEQKNMSIGQNLPVDPQFVTSDRAIVSWANENPFSVCAILNLCVNLCPSQQMPSDSPLPTVQPFHLHYLTKIWKTPCQPRKEREHHGENCTFISWRGCGYIHNFNVILTVGGFYIRFPVSFS